jgi:hypothetical protein
LMQSLPPLELELLLVASTMTNRSENFKKIMQKTGMLDRFEDNFSSKAFEEITSLGF